MMDFRIGITPDYRTPDGSLPEHVKPLLRPGVTVEFLPEGTKGNEPDVIDRYDALIASSTPYTRASFAGIGRLLALCRFGVGYDAIDLEAANEAGVMVTITRGAPSRPVAEAALTLMLAVGHHVVMKDRLTREGRWDDRWDYTGVELRDRTVGIVGFGGIGRELVRLLGSFGIARALAYDPYLDPETARAQGVELVSLETLLRESDFVSVHCALTPETRGLIGERELDWMRPGAILVNTARGPIVDQDALTRALQERRIRGAGLDVFREEPTRPDDPLLALDNVILSPHALCLTEEMYRDYYASIRRTIECLIRGEVPADVVVNPAALEHPGLRERLARRQGRG